MRADQRRFIAATACMNARGTARASRALIILRILEGFDLPEDALDQPRACIFSPRRPRIAYHLRDSLIGDPRSRRSMSSGVLLDEAIAALRAAIRLDRAAEAGAAAEETPHKDTRLSDRGRPRPQCRLADQLDLLGLRQRPLCAALRHHPRRTAAPASA